MWYFVGPYLEVFPFPSLSRLACYSKKLSTPLAAALCPDLGPDFHGTLYPHQAFQLVVLKKLFMPLFGPGTFHHTDFSYFPGWGFSPALSLLPGVYKEIPVKPWWHSLKTGDLCKWLSVLYVIVYVIVSVRIVSIWLPSLSVFTGLWDTTVYLGHMLPQVLSVRPVLTHCFRFWVSIPGFLGFKTPSFKFCLCVSDSSLYMGEGKDSQLCY